MRFRSKTDRSFLREFSVKLLRSIAATAMLLCGCAANSPPKAVVPAEHATAEALFNHLKRSVLDGNPDLLERSRTAYSSAILPLGSSWDACSMFELPQPFQDMDMFSVLQRGAFRGERQLEANERLMLVEVRRGPERVVVQFLVKEECRQLRLADREQRERGMAWVFSG